MKVFLSWSGDLSRSIAMVLGEMLPQVLQIVDPYFSPDIEKGARWAIDLARELEAAKFGIICVTPDNIDAPWLNFEAGALSKALDTGRVTPFLVGMRAANLRGPLVQFQATVAEKEDVWKLVRSLNQKTETFQLDETKLRKGFEKWWPELDEGITAAQSDAKIPSARSEHKDSTETIEELVELARAQYRILSALPEQLGALSASALAPEPIFIQDASTLPPITMTSDGYFAVGPDSRGVTTLNMSRDNVVDFLTQEGLSPAIISSLLSKAKPGQRIYLSRGLAGRSVLRDWYDAQSRPEPQARQSPVPPEPPESAGGKSND